MAEHKQTVARDQILNLTKAVANATLYSSTLAQAFARLASDLDQSKVTLRICSEKVDRAKASLARANNVTTAFNEAHIKAKKENLAQASLWKSRVDTLHQKLDVLMRDQGIPVELRNKIWSMIVKYYPDTPMPVENMDLDLVLANNTVRGK